MHHTKKARKNKKSGFFAKLKKLCFLNQVKFLSKFIYSPQILKCCFSLPGHKKPRLSAPAISSSSDSDSSSSDSDKNKEDDLSPPKTKKFKIPKIKKPNLRPKEMIQALRDDLPNLNHHSDDVLQKLSWSELFHLDSKLDSRGKSGKKMTERLQKNLEKIKKYPVKSRLERTIDRTSSTALGLLADTSAKIPTSGSRLVRLLVFPVSIQFLVTTRTVWV